MTHHRRDKVFISYSHKDKRLFDELIAPLKWLQKAGLLEFWEDTRIAPGMNWRDEIARALASARVAVLLVSQDFQNSDFIDKDELPPLLQAADAGELTIMPVHIRTSMWEHGGLAHLQAANDPKSPIGAMTPNERAAAFKAVAKKLLDILGVPAVAAPSPSTPPGLPGAMSAGAPAVSTGAGQHALPSAQALASLVAPAQAHLGAERRPRAEFEALFEIIDDAADPLPALYGVESAHAAEQGLDYIDAREDGAPLRPRLVQALLAADGRLLVSGRGGIGKTREVAELARDWCERGWTTCVARGGQADAEMGELAGLPTRLADARLLVVVDNLHLRGAATLDEADSYLDRLEACLASLLRLAPGGLRVLAIARNEPLHARRLGLDPALARWRGFGVFTMPEFSADGLAQLLARLGARAGLHIEPADALQRVLDSDRKPRTLVINVRRIARLGAPLDSAHWLPREGDSWHESIAAAAARQPAIGALFRAMHLLAAAELMPRRSSLVALATQLAEGPPRHEDAAAALDSLVDGGLAGLRGDVLRLFNDELIGIGLRHGGTEAPPLAAHWPDLIAALSEPAPQPAWTADLLALGYALVRAARPDDAVQVTSLAIDLSDGAAPRRARAAAHFVARRYVDCRADLDAALEAAPDDLEAHRLRALVRNLLGEHAGLVADADEWLRLAPTDLEAHTMRSLGLFALGRLAEAEANLDAAIAGGTRESMAWFLRAMARWQRNDFAGADSDFSIVLDAGFDIGLAQRRIEVLSHGDASQVIDTLREAASLAVRAGHVEDTIPPEGAAALTPGRAFVHGMRGVARLRLGRWADAEEDFSRAFEGDYGQAFRVMRSSIDSSGLPGLHHASASLATAEQAGMADTTSMRMLRGLVRVEQGKNEAALEDLDAAIACSIGGADALFGRAVALTRLGRLAAARADLDACLVAGADTAPVRSLRGGVAYELGDFEPAAADIEAAIAHGRDDAWVHQVHAVSCHRLGRLDAAAAAAERLLARAPEAALAWFVRGSIRFDQKRFAEALADLDEAIGRGDTLPGARALRGLLHVQEGRFTEAEPDLAAAAGSGMRDANVMYALGTVKLARDAFAEAEAHCNDAIAAGRDDAWVYYVRGRALYRLDREAEAEADYDAALARGMDSAELHYWRGSARAWQWKHDEALQDFDLAAENGMADDAQLRVLRGRALLRLHQSQRALDDFDRAIELNRDDAVLRTLRGEALLQLGQRAEAGQDFARALATAPDHAGALRWAAEVELGEARFAEARAHLDRLVALMPSNGEALATRGVARYAQGDIEGAGNDFAAGLELEPQDISIPCRIALVLLRHGWVDAAAEQLEAARAIDAAHEELLGTEGVLMVARGQLADAEARFASLAGHDWACWRGLAALMAGDAARALALYRAAAPELVAGDRALSCAELKHWWGQSPRRAAEGDPPELPAIEALLAT